MRSWIRNIEPILTDILSRPSSGSDVFDKRIVKEMLVAEWLIIKGYKPNWSKLFYYNKILEYRTYENASIGFTFILNSDETGTLSLIDGALVLDKKGRIISFGAMIKSHNKSSTELGARSSAALSAYYYGALPFKVSSDGEIVALINTGSSYYDNHINIPANSPTKVTFF